MIINKQYLRQWYIKLRKNLSKTQQQDASVSICTQIQNLKIYKEAHTIALYHAIANEIDLTPLWNHAIENNKTCYMPTIQPDKTLSFIKQSPDEASHANSLGIPEPIFHINKQIGLNQIDLMILPLVAFDSKGTRLGWGAGYYDRTLAFHRPNCLLGVAYALQEQPMLPHEPWDIALDLIVTEEQILWVNTSLK